MEGLDKGGQGPTSGCCAIVEDYTYSIQYMIFLRRKNKKIKSQTQGSPCEI
jgi:hypothetical protein